MRGKVRKKLLPLWNEFLLNNQPENKKDNDNILHDVSNFQELMDYCIDNYREFTTVSDFER